VEPAAQARRKTVLSFTTNLCLYVDYQLEYHLRIPVLKYGSPGPLGLVADNLRADDFCIRDIRSNVYSTHPANTVLKLEPDGTRITIAGPEEEWNFFFHFFCTLTIPPSQKLPPRSTSYEVGRSLVSSPLNSQASSLVPCKSISTNWTPMWFQGRAMS